MSMDKSLKLSGGLARHNNVLSRAARIAQLQDEDRWDPQRSPFGLPKVSNRKAKVGGKAKKKDTAAEGETPTENKEGAAGGTEGASK